MSTAMIDQQGMPIQELLTLCTVAMHMRRSGDPRFECFLASSIVDVPSCFCFSVHIGKNVKKRPFSHTAFATSLLACDSIPFHFY